MHEEALIFLRNLAFIHQSVLMRFFLFLWDFTDANIWFAAKKLKNQNPRKSKKPLT